MAISFAIQRDDRTFQARADGAAPFFVGFETRYTDKSTGEVFDGLYNVPTTKLVPLLYDAKAATPSHGFWADFIAPTSHCEGGNFLTLNTYDRARFTWGFGQFAAHVADGDFVLFFRDMLGRPEATDYFPELMLKDGRICQITGNAVRPLETEQSTSGLMDYLNPSSAAVDDAEVLAAARLIHWTTQHTAAQDLQTLHMVGAFKKIMGQADRHLGLDGLSADICCVVCDILHQGRSTYASMQQALRQPKPLDELLLLGSHSYPDRIKSLETQLSASAQLFAVRRWNRQAADFV